MISVGNMSGTATELGQAGAGAANPDRRGTFGAVLTRRRV
jgi:hypothetical protein